MNLNIKLKILENVWLLNLLNFVLKIVSGGVGVKGLAFLGLVS